MEDKTKPRNPSGRKSKFNELFIEAIALMCEEGKTDEEIAKALGIGRKTLCVWKGKHPALRHAMAEAKLNADDLVEAALFRKAVGFSERTEKHFFDPKTGEVIVHVYEHSHPPDTRAAQFWLRNRRPKRWRKEEEEAAIDKTGTTFNLNYKIDDKKE